jgi:tetratricopeptide (TPR) repeat protein
VPPKPKIGKELKQPDQFVSFWAKAGEWLSTRRRPVIGALVAVLVGAAGVWAVQSLMDTRAERASRDFARIHQVATATLLPEKDDGNKPTDDVPHFKTDRERLEAAVKEADGFVAGHGASLREEALLLKARYLVALGKADEALAIYQDIGGSLDQRLRFLALEGTGYALEAAGQLDKAIAAFDHLAEQAKSAGNLFRDRALYNKARLLERKGSAKEAEKVYRAVLAEAPTTALRDEINNRLGVLESK